MKALIRNLVHKIAQHVHPDKVILFGSQAWGGADKGSDVDLLVIMPSVERPAKRSMMIKRALSSVKAPLDILVRTPLEIEERLALKDPFMTRILEQGKVLYDAQAR